MAADLIHLPWRDVAIGDGAQISTSLLAEEADALASLAAAAGDVLEIGSAYGYSAVVMALAGATVTAVDWHLWIKDSRAVMESNLDAYGVRDKVSIVQEPALNALQRLASEGARFGLVFIDGNHDYEFARDDIAGALKVLKPGGVLAVHDYDEDCSPGVRQAVDEAFPDGPDEVTGTLATVKV